jgi:hypothetical protein
MSKLREAARRVDTSGTTGSRRSSSSIVTANEVEVRRARCSVVPKSISTGARSSRPPSSSPWLFALPASTVPSSPSAPTISLRKFSQIEPKIAHSFLVLGRTTALVAYLIDHPTSTKDVKKVSRIIADHLKFFAIRTAQDLAAMVGSMYTDPYHHCFSGSVHGSRHRMSFSALLLVQQLCFSFW